MGAVIFSDVHADSSAIGTLASCIRTPLFRRRFGGIDVIINLGDLLHRGDHPKETLEKISLLSGEYPFVSVLGNHDHAYLHGLLVSGSDAVSMYRHEQLRNSPLLSIFDGMPMEYIDSNMLFVHGGPLDLGNQTLRLKCWQRLAHHSGDSFSGYHYTAPMAFNALEARGISHMCCGHQHAHTCCRKAGNGIVEETLVFKPVPREPADGDLRLEEAVISLDVPTLLRIGGCHGDEPEFAYTDFLSFSFIRIHE